MKQALCALMIRARWLAIGLVVGAGCSLYFTKTYAMVTFGEAGVSTVRFIEAAETAYSAKDRLALNDLVEKNQ